MTKDVRSGEAVQKVFSIALKFYMLQISNQMNSKKGSLSILFSVLLEFGYFFVQISNLEVTCYAFSTSRPK